MREELLKVVEEMELRFKSGNHVSLSRASITAGEWKLIKAALVSDTCIGKPGFAACYPNIAKAAQSEPVAEVDEDVNKQGTASTRYVNWFGEPPEAGTKLYTSPPSAQVLVASEVHEALVQDGYYGPYVLGTALWEKFDAAFRRQNGQE